MRKHIAAALERLLEKVREPGASIQSDDDEAQTDRELHIPPSWSERFFTSAGAGTLMTVAIIAVGVSVSLFTEAIREVGFYYDFSGRGHLFGAVVFWVLVALVVVLAIATSAFSAKKGRRERGNLEQSLTKLDKAVARLNTLPSETFLPAYQDAYGNAFGAAMLATLDTSAKLDTVEFAIRSVLAAIADTAKDFDGAQGPVVYGANIMLFRYRSEPPFDPAAVHLVNVGPSHAGEFSGCLELIPSLSTSTANPGFPDAGTIAIALPIPEDCEDFYDEGEKTKKSPVMPGAPTAFVERAFDGFSSIERFLKKLYHRTSLDRKLIDRAKKYFTTGAGKHICSFASLPILDIQLVDDPVVGRIQRGGSPSAQAVLEVPLPLGVLNIHSEEEGLLEDNGSSMFAPLMAPFLKLLAILIAKRRELLDVAEEPEANCGDAVRDPGTQAFSREHLPTQLGQITDRSKS